VKGKRIEDGAQDGAQESLTMPCFVSARAASLYPFTFDLSPYGHFIALAPRRESPFIRSGGKTTGTGPRLYWIYSKTTPPIETVSR